MLNTTEPRAGSFANRQTGTIRTRWSDLLAKLIPPPTTLAEARADPDGAVVLDTSESIYLVCPAALVRCGEPALARLLADFDVLLWNDSPYAHVRYRRLRAPARVQPTYPCFSVEYTGTFWLHPRFAPFAIESAVRDVLAGHLEALPWPAEVLLRRAKSAEPDRVLWPRRLAELFRARMERAAGEERIALAAEALTEYETVLALDQNYRRDLVPALTCAFEAGAYRTAAGLADRLLACSWRDVARARWGDYTGQCICYAHTILGRIAVRAGDDTGTRGQLAEAAKAPFTPKPDEVRFDAILIAELNGLA
jgi:hypothetical protein